MVSSLNEKTCLQRGTTMKKRDVFLAAAAATAAVVVGKAANAAAMGPVLAVISH